MEEPANGPMPFAVATTLHAAKPTAARWTPRAPRNAAVANKKGKNEKRKTVPSSRKNTTHPTSTPAKDNKHVSRIALKLGSWSGHSSRPMQSNVGVTVNEPRKLPTHQVAQAAPGSPN